MSQKSLLSIILSFRDQRDIVESTLTSVFELDATPFELVIIDDASTDGTGDAIQSLLDYYEHEHTYFFQHEEAAGRGNCLNEALQQADSPFIWCPVSLERIDEKRLNHILDEAAHSRTGCILQQASLPENTGEWLAYATRQQWPGDGSFLWNTEVIPSPQCFFNPYQHKYHGVEMAARLSATDAITVTQVETFGISSSREEPVAPSETDRHELIYAILRTAGIRSRIGKEALQLLEQLPAPDLPKGEADFDNDLFAQAFQMKQDGRLSSALELAEHLLEQDPGNPEARQLKIQILEKKRRFVEASELKHEIDSGKRSDSTEDKITTSIIIPTALHGKPVLEQCLISVSEYCNPQTTELIVIDNASLDDTHDYLTELENKGFFNSTIITNNQNKGFAASVNQGLEAARGNYGLVLHNDVVLEEELVGKLEELMDGHPRYAVIGPLSNKTLNPDQSIRNREEYESKLLQTEYLDSFCMMIRLDTGLRMDESYELSFFEDIDFCFEARKSGYKVGIATQVSVGHQYGTTTFALNLDTESEQYWKNVAYFNEKWGVEVYSEEDLKSKSTFDQLLALDELVNPLFPEDSIRAYFEELFTDELKTEMMRARHDPETLCRLVHLMMVMEQREVMRRLEDRLDNIELPSSLTYQLIRFYFNRNIFSRCRHYLDKLKAEQQSLQSELYKLAIMISDKELDQAIPKLKELLDQAPSNPTLYKLAGDLHQFEGNEEEAESFYKIAAQINPFEYAKAEEKEFGLKGESTLK